MRLSFRCDRPARFRLALRCPYWATEGMVISINGKRSPLTGQPGNYAVLEREWKTGDRVELRLPMVPRMETMPDNPRRVAFLKGPILLAGDLGPADDPAAQDPNYVPVLVTGDRPVQEWLKSTGKPLEFRLVGIGQPRDVSLKPFYSLHERRYGVYWDILTPAQWSDLKAQRQAEQAARQALDARTVDKVEIGEAASEAAHQLKAERSNTGLGAYGQHMQRRWRDAPDGWFSFDLKVLPDQVTTLSVTYWGKEVGDRTFDVLVDGKKIATTSLDSSRPEAFYDVNYPIPMELTGGKDKVTVRFQAHPGNTAGGVFGIRTLRTPSP